MRRERRTREEWKAILADQQTSGITAREYCAKHSIHLQTFYARKSDIDKRPAQPTSKLVKLVRAEPETISTTPKLAVVYHGVTLKVEQAVEAKWLADVMKALVS